eukprot:755182-Hanusia_phi.AAC.1
MQPKEGGKDRLPSFPSPPLPSFPFPSLPLPSLPFPSLPLPSLPFLLFPVLFLILPARRSTWDTCKMCCLPKGTELLLERGKKYPLLRCRNVYMLPGRRGGTRRAAPSCPWQEYRSSCGSSSRMRGRWYGENAGEEGGGRRRGEKGEEVREGEGKERK